MRARDKRTATETSGADVLSSKKKKKASGGVGGGVNVRGLRIPSLLTGRRRTNELYTSVAVVSLG